MDWTPCRLAPTDSAPYEIRTGTRELASEANAVASVHFARDYSFRELQSNKAILIGNTVSNPWIDAFRDHIGFGWKYDSVHGAYYPVDNRDPRANSGDQFRASGDGYASIALLPNLSGTGTVLILSSSCRGRLPETPDITGSLSRISKR